MRLGIAGRAVGPSSEQQRDGTENDEHDESLYEPGDQPDGGAAGNGSGAGSDTTEARDTCNAEERPPGRSVRIHREVSANETDMYSVDFPGRRNGDVEIRN
ncbi:hypothetical protein ATJ93_3867 [Halopiger aswanensis]|uniref:Uncharacterized protein n=1 Tax=Halopiger aswanensis TaxID=148449 RepID=A0A419W0M9_9EURY|nr:hypothetical protein ATJ93_3867 [Halopiger aswanensis]